MRTMQTCEGNGARFEQPSERVSQALALIFIRMTFRILLERRGDARPTP